MNITQFCDESMSEAIRKLVASRERSLPPKIFVPGETSIPASGKVIDSDEKELMIAAALDGWLTTGRFNAMFEERLAKFIGVKHLRTVNSGSSANLVAFSSLTSPSLGPRAICPGDEVITVAAGFPTTINPIIQNGAVPVFVDVCINTLNVNVDQLAAAVTSKTKAVMLAHTLGNPFNVAAVKDICDRHDLWLVEDCCDALGSAYEGKHVGLFGDIATLSFYPAHHITMGEGGAVFTNNDELITAAESIRDWGRDCYCPPGSDNTCGKRFDQQFSDLPEGYDHKYVYSHVGYNLKITDMQAACGLAQLNKLDSFIAQRKTNFRWLTERLGSIRDNVLLATPTPNSSPSWFGFPITLTEESEISRRELTKYLDELKIGTRLLFAGNITKQPMMQGRSFRIASELTQTDVVMSRTFWLGIHPQLDEERLEFVAQSLEAFFGVGF